MRITAALSGWLVLTGLLATAQATHAADWPQFRGPAFNGSSPEKNLPVEFSATKNVVWAADLPGASAATPIIVGDHVFVSSTDVESQSVCAICLDRKTGQQLWKRRYAKGISQDSRSNYASPTPASDGQRVIFFSGTGDLAAFSVKGQPLWSRNLQKDYGAFNFLWTFSSSPLLFDGKLYLQVLQRDVPVRGRGVPNAQSYLLAMDPASGKTLWRHVRPTQARQESREAFSTPTPLVTDSRRELLVVGGDDITGHDPETGKELWRWGTWNPKRITHWRLCPSPVAGGGVVLVCAPKRDPIYAVKLGGKGKLDDSSIAWTSRDLKQVTSDVPTPAYYDGDFFVLSDVRKSLTRVDPQTGKARWTLRTPGTSKYEASPLAADGKIYLINFVGQVVVVDAKTGKVLHIAKMDEPADDAVRSSIAAAHGQLFIRVNRKLYCVAK